MMAYTGCFALFKLGEDNLEVKKKLLREIFYKRFDIKSLDIKYCFIYYYIY